MGGLGKGNVHLNQTALCNFAMTLDTLFRWLFKIMVGFYSPFQILNTSVQSLRNIENLLKYMLYKVFLYLWNGNIILKQK